MSNIAANELCACGQYHPAGVRCEPIGLRESAPSPAREEQPRHHRDSRAHAHDHDPNPTGHTHGACCCAHQADRAAQAVDPVSLRSASATRVLYRIPNMDCPMEEALIRTKLQSLEGIAALEFNLIRRVLTVNHNLASTTPIEEALRSIDMTPEILGAVQGSVQTPAPRISWRRLAVAGMFAAVSELFELIQEWQINPFGVGMNAWRLGGVDLVEWLPALLAVIAIVLGGLSTYKKGWIAIRNRNLNINALMSVAVTGAALIGQYPEAAMVMVLFNLAEAIEAKSLDRARKAIRDLLDLTPERATVQQADGQWEVLDIGQVGLNAQVRVRPGERVALDGVIVQGQSAVNQAPITGESLPVEKGVGDTVYAGTINESGSFEFAVTALASDSTLARIIHAVEEAQGSRAPIQRFVDQFARYYTPAIFLSSLLAALIPPLFLGGAWTEWIYTALIILVIGCPCALVISTPVSIASGMAAAARQGILVKGGMFLEMGRQLKWLALDKTGTITHGKPCQTDFLLLGELDEQCAVALAASIAIRSDHPVSRAVAVAAAEHGIACRNVTDFAAIPGQGVSAVLDGVTWYLGNRRMLEDQNKCSPTLEEHILGLERQGKSVVLLIGPGGAQALFAVADTLRDSSVEAVRELRKLGVSTMMLSGDNEYTAAAIAAQVGVDDCRGNLLPQDKLAAVEKLAEFGTVGMVGDGINDAPALARADIGFAMAAAGTDTAIETADVALMDDDLRKIPRFIRLSRATYAILLQNIGLALGVKALFLALTFAGQATMWLAVFADVGTSLLVVANGLRAMRKNV